MHPTLLHLRSIATPENYGERILLRAIEAAWKTGVSLEETDAVIDGLRAQMETQWAQDDRDLEVWLATHGDGATTALNGRKPALNYQYTHSPYRVPVQPGVLKQGRLRDGDTRRRGLVTVFA